MRGIAPPTTLSVKVKPEPRGSALTSIVTSANWPCPPLCRLKRECCWAPWRIVSLYGDRRGLAADREVVAVAQPVERDLQMDVALPPQHHLLGVGVLLELEGRILLDQLADGAGQLDVVLRASRSGSRGRKTGCGRSGRVSGSALPDGVSTAPVCDVLHAGQPDDLAGLGGRHLLLLGADQAQQPGDAGAVEQHAFGDRAAPDADQRQLAGMRQVIRS